MIGTGSVEHLDSHSGPRDDARRGVEQAEAGETAGAEQVERARDADPAGVDSVEQEAADGPEGRGLSR